MATWLKVALALDRLTISGRRLWCGMFSRRDYGWSVRADSAGICTGGGVGVSSLRTFARRSLSLGCGAGPRPILTTGAGQTPNTGQSKGRHGDLYALEGVDRKRCCSTQPRWDI